MIMATDIDNNLEDDLYDNICSVIEEVRYRIAVYVNSEASFMNWHVGKQVKDSILFNKRSEYGDQILKRLS